MSAMVFLKDASFLIWCTVFLYRLESAHTSGEFLRARACETGQLYPHPDSCSKYFSCSNNELIEQTCMEGLYFSEFLQRCEMKDNVECHIIPGPTSTPPTTPTPEDPPPSITATAPTEETPTPPPPYSLCSIHPTCGIYPHPFFAHMFFICPDSFSDSALIYSCTPGNLYSQALEGGGGGGCLPDAFCSFHPCGLHPHPVTNTSFYVCLDDRDRADILLHCSPGNVFNSSMLECERDPFAVDPTTTIEPSPSTFTSTTEPTDWTDESSNGSSSSTDGYSSSTDFEGYEGQDETFVFNDHVK